MPLGKTDSSGELTVAGIAPISIEELTSLNLSVIPEMMTAG